MFYLQRLEAGLFTLQFVDNIMLEICHRGAESVSVGEGEMGRVDEMLRLFCLNYNYLN